MLPNYTALTSEETKTGGVSLATERNISYQVFKLSKIMETRNHNNSTFQALSNTTGLEYIYPDYGFHENVLTNMFYEEGQDTKCKFLIVVAMYNESAEHFTNTMIGVNENLNYFKSAGVDPNEVACIIIVDGMKPFLETYRKQEGFFSQFFDENLIKQRFRTKDILDCKISNQKEYDEFAHCFVQKIVFGSSNYPLNFCFCVKQFNKRKLNTHLWFFGGFCEMIQPTYVMLLDVGTKPLAGSLFYLYEAMVCDNQLAGCCGEIKPMDYNIWKIVVPAQFVEYKFAHMLDKALESVIGYITVLPGAFSAYRWEALQGGPLWDDYFKSICHPELMDAFQSNIYLAEDRVLCLSLISKKGFNYTLRYVRSSVAETDVPDSISILMAQRRRWINGSWFALVDALKRFQKIYHSSHNPIRKCLFTFQMTYYFLNVIYTWFIVGGFCLALIVAVRKNIESYYYKGIGDMLILVYLSIILMIFITSLGVKPRRVEDFYKILSVILGLYQIYTMYLITYFVATLDFADGSKMVAVGISFTILSFAAIIILNCETWLILKGVFHYIFLIPTYVNIFLIYSICNVHDCTWGNRPDALSNDEKNRLEEFEEFRTRWAIIWALCNSGFAYGMGELDKQSTIYSFYFLAAISGSGIGILILRVLGGILFVFIECCKKKLKRDSSLLNANERKKRGSVKIIQAPHVIPPGNFEEDNRQREISNIAKLSRNESSTIIENHQNKAKISTSEEEKGREIFTFKSESPDFGIDPINEKKKKNAKKSKRDDGKRKKKSSKKSARLKFESENIYIPPINIRKEGLGIGNIENGLNASVDSKKSVREVDAELSSRKKFNFEIDKIVEKIDKEFEKNNSPDPEE
ncbi:hypothetical protein SteCoe_5130 [Stentor coeruleus]|uniref:chitin synthase n=1 Tax=Stentor coeruleus TaxID=5963 RepID=A0A1R2CT06_9CILI|nr:hypothetical protein SteCoe_5130 [Stentor coeruleus]